jgi:Ca2+-binding RTX toxin-like protein
MPTFNGTAGNDIFTGGADNDTLIGGAGNDTLTGAGGNDLLVGGAGVDKLDGGDGDDTLYSSDQSPAFNLPYPGNSFTPPVLDTGTEVDTLIGGDGSDRLFAGYGDNVDGGANGWYGDYLYISFMGAPSGVHYDSSLATQTIGGGTITGIENVSWIQGSNYADDITAATQYGGYSEFTAVYGMGGDDKLVAGYYTGSLFGGDGNDIVDGRPSQYLFTVDGGAGNDTIYTNTNTFAEAYGGDGDDTIYAHGKISGGAGADKIFVQFSYYAGLVTGDAGNDEIHASNAGTTMAGGDGADNLFGDAGADRIYSGNMATDGSVLDDLAREHDILAGAGGNDFLAAGYGDDVDGGDGADTLSLSLAGAAGGVTFDTTALVSGLPTTVFGGAIKNVEILTYLRGSDFADTLTLATQATLLTVDAGAGNDVIVSSGSSVFAKGGAGDDRFVSGPAGDIFDGGAGIDTIDYSSYAAAATVDLSAGTGAGGDQLSNIEVVIGSKFADTLKGGALADTFHGGLGDDAIDGGAGRDMADYSGLSTDFSWSRGSDGVVTVKDLRVGALNEGTDKLSNIEVLIFTDRAIELSGTTTTPPVTTPPVTTPPVTTPPVTTPTQNLVQGTAGSDNLYGTSGHDLMKGLAGDDFLYGTLGDDVFDGGDGRDLVLFIDAASAIKVDLSVLAAQNTGQGLDTFISIETLTGGAYNDTLLGDSGANGLSGQGGDDILDGRGGDDSISGDAGNDVIHGGDGADNLVGGSGDDFVYGDAGDDYLWISTENTAYAVGNDFFDGGSGVDTVQVGYAATGLAINLGVTERQQIAPNIWLTVKNVENLFGGYYNDVLTGDAGDNVIGGYDGDDQIDGGAGVDTLWMRGNSTDYVVTQTADGWKITDKRAPAAFGSGQISDGVDTVKNVEFVQFYDKTVSLGGSSTPTSTVDPLAGAKPLTSQTAPTAVSNILRGSATEGQTSVTANVISNQLAIGAITPATALKEIIQTASATTSVAILAYQFFTGKIPTAAGLDYLVSPTGPNVNNLNSAYYQAFNLENRYINFAVNLGKSGEGKDAFAAAYGSLTLASATRVAYTTIFGVMPSDAKVVSLLAGGRDAYLASYGKGGLDDIGTKAAMVGWLLAEAVKADVGTYAHINDAFLGDLADGANYAVDLVGVYSKPEYALAAA